MSRVFSWAVVFCLRWVVGFVVCKSLPVNSVSFSDPVVSEMPAVAATATADKGVGAEELYVLVDKGLSLLTEEQKQALSSTLTEWAQQAEEHGGTIVSDLKKEAEGKREEVVALYNKATVSVGLAMELAARSKTLLEENRLSGAYVFQTFSRVNFSQYQSFLRQALLKQMEENTRANNPANNENEGNNLEDLGSVPGPDSQ